MATPVQFDLPLWVRFRIIGCFRAGFLKVEPLAPGSPDPGAVVFFRCPIDEVRAELVPEDRRIPNSEFWAFVSKDFTILEVARKPPAV